LRENLSKKKSGEGERSGIRVERQEKGRRKERKREDSKGQSSLLLVIPCRPSLVIACHPVAFC
jgi:hypothetical protein